jgi:hypothetical protein
MRPICYVKWIDSGISFGNGWRDKEEVLDEIEQEKEPAESVGFLMKEDKDWLILFCTMSNNNVNGGITINKKNIIERAYIKI